jgi:hypothetical protein
MNLSERDPRDQWWTDLCADVAQAGPARLASLPIVSPVQNVRPAPPEPDDAAHGPPIPASDTGVDGETDSGAGNPT